MTITHRTTTAIIGGTQWNETHVMLMVWFTYLVRYYAKN